MNEITGNRIHEIMGWWQEGISMSKTGYLLMGKAIHYIKEEKIWQYHTEHTTFKYWIEHELQISVAQAHRLSQIYQEVGHILPDIPIEIGKVTLLLPYLHNKTDEQKAELLVGARDCSIEDIRNNIRDWNGNSAIATDVCIHETTEAYQRCVRCGKWLRSEQSLNQ